MLPLYISLSTDQSQEQMCELMSQVNEKMDTDQYIIVGGLSSWSPSLKDLISCCIAERVFIKGQDFDVLPNTSSTADLKCADVQGSHHHCLQL